MYFLSAILCALSIFLVVKEISPDEETSIETSPASTAATSNTEPTFVNEQTESVSHISATDDYSMVDKLLQNEGNDLRLTTEESITTPEMESDPPEDSTPVPISSQLLDLDNDEMKQSPDETMSEENIHTEADYSTISSQLLDLDNDELKQSSDATLSEENIHTETDYSTTSNDSPEEKVYMQRSSTTENSILEQNVSTQPVETITIPPEIINFKKIVLKPYKPDTLFYEDHSVSPYTFSYDRKPVIPTKSPELQSESDNSRGIIIFIPPGNLLPKLYIGHEPFQDKCEREKPVSIEPAKPSSVLYLSRIALNFTIKSVGAAVLVLTALKVIYKYFGLQNLYKAWKSQDYGIDFIARNVYRAISDLRSKQN